MQSVNITDTGRSAFDKTSKNLRSIVCVMYLPIDNKPSINKKPLIEPFISAGDGDICKAIAPVIYAQVINSTG